MSSIRRWGHWQIAVQRSGLDQPIVMFWAPTTHWDSATRMKNLAYTYCTYRTLTMC